MKLCCVMTRRAEEEFSYTNILVYGNTSAGWIADPTDGETSNDRSGERERERKKILCFLCAHLGKIKENSK